MYKLKLVSHYFQKQKGETNTFVPAFIYTVSGSPDQLAEYQKVKGANARFYGINPETDEAYEETDSHFVPKSHPDYGKPLYFTTQAVSLDQDDTVSCTMSIKGDNVFFNKVVTTQDLLDELAEERALAKKLKAAKKAGLAIF